MLMSFLTEILQSAVSHRRRGLLFKAWEGRPAGFVGWGSLHFGKTLSVFAATTWALHPGTCGMNGNAASSGL